MTTAPAKVPANTTPVVFVLWRRHNGGRWVKVATAPTRRELFDAMKGTADYMLLPVTDVRFATTAAPK